MRELSERVPIREAENVRNLYHPLPLHVSPQKPGQSKHGLGGCRGCLTQGNGLYSVMDRSLLVACRMLGSKDGKEWSMVMKLAIMVYGCLIVKVHDDDMVVNSWLMVQVHDNT